MQHEVQQYMADIGQGIQQARLLRGYSVEDLAQRAGISRRHIQQIEAGGNTSVQTLLRLCQALHVFPPGLPVPRALVGQTVRAAAHVLGLDLVELEAPPPARKRKR